VLRSKFSAVFGILACVSAASVPAQTLSKKTDIDFFRDVPSRNLKGLATRSDGRLVAGPALRDLAAPAPADLLWCLEPTSDAAKFLLGTGPDGRIFEVTLDAAATSFTTREVVKLDDPQVFSVKRLADGSILAGTSPKGALYLIRDDQPVARVALPVDSIFDLLVVDAKTALVATGNPGKIYRVDLDKFAAAGVTAEKITDTAQLSERGVTVFGEIRDRNVRRVAALPDGRIAAGSAPKGNIYTFGRDGGAPVILQENRDAEVTDLLALPNGDLYATIVFSTTTNETRITPPTTTATGTAAPNTPPRDNTPPPAQVERFAGRTSLVRFPAGGFAEGLTARNNTAFYRVAARGDLLILAGGELGELLGYDLTERLSVTFGGSISSQVNGLVALSADRFLLLRNNAPGLAVLDFAAGSVREIETRRLDLGVPAQLGALRFNRLRNLNETGIAAEIRLSNGTDEVEGWGPWTPLVAAPDAGWRAEGLRGRYAKLRLRLTNDPAADPTRAGLEIDRVSLYFLPQNRRPQLQEFRVLPPGYAIVPPSEPPPPIITSLSQLTQPPKEDERRRTLTGAQAVAAPGVQVVTWNVSDPDGDVLLCSFSIRRDGDSEWTDLVNLSRDNFALFDTNRLPDGVYFTRLVATETAPRPEKERFTQTFFTDDLIVDHTPPEIIEATARRQGTSLIVSVHGRDRLSLLDGIEVVFNNGVREVVEQPADGVRDGREETFVLELPLARVSNATSLEVSLADQAGNSVARRLTW
jgi:hypothetical protein